MEALDQRILLSVSGLTPDYLTAHALVNVTSPQIVLDWSASSDPNATISIYRGTTPGGENYTSPIVTGLSSTSFDDSNVAPGVQYFYTLKAADGSQVGPASSESSATSAPDAIGDLQATVSGNGSQVQLTWSAPTDTSGNPENVTSYQVCRATIGSDPAQATPIQVTGTTYTDTTVTPGTQYWYFIQAINDGGPSSIAGVQVDTSTDGNYQMGQQANGHRLGMDGDDTAPDAPTQLGAVLGMDTWYYNNPVALYWTAPAGSVSSYQIFRSATPGAEDYNNPIATVDGGTCWYMDSAPAGETPFYYTVVALNDAGASLPSDELAVTSGPAAPANPQATANGAYEIDLTWSDPNPTADSFQVYRSTSPIGTGGAQLIATVPSGCSYADTTVNAGTTYYYKIVAVDPRGISSSPSDQASTTSDDSSTGIVPLAPYNLGASNSVSTQTGNNIVTLFWGERSDLVSFQVFRATSPGAEDYNNPVAIITDPGVTTYADAAPQPLTRYYYTVIAVNAAGPSPASTEASTVSGLAAPSAGASAAGPAEIDLTWSDPNNLSADRYSVYRRQTPTGLGGTLIASNLATCSYTDTTGLAAGTTYYYQVDATNNGTRGNFSTTVSATTAPAIASPAWASATTITGTIVDLSVLGASDLGESTLTYTWSVTSDDDAPAGSVTFTDNASNSAQDTTAVFTGAGDYDFLATITDGNGQSNTSSIAVTVDQTLTSITITPSAAPIAIVGGSQQFAATGLDQFGAALTTQPTFTWSVAPGDEFGGLLGTIDSTGFYTAPAPIHDATDIIEASTAGVSGTALAICQTLTTINVIPDVNSIPSGGTQQFVATGLDEFGNPMVFQPTFSWSLIGDGDIGSIDCNGLYTAPTTQTGEFTVEASSGGIIGTEDPSAGPAPAAAWASTVSTTQVDLIWDAVSGATGYDIYRGITPGGEGATPINNTNPVTATHYSDTGLTIGTPYYYRVAAVFGGTPGAQSPEVAGATSSVPITGPGAPIGLNGWGGYNLGLTPACNAVTLSWTSVASDAGCSFYIERGVSSNDELGIVGIVPGPSSAAPAHFIFVDTASSQSRIGPLAMDTTYYYYVVAVNGAGISAPSNQCVVTSAPYAPTLATPVTTHPGEIDLSWSNNTLNTHAHVDSYTIYRSTTYPVIQSGATILRDNVQATSYNDFPVNSGTTYYYAIAATAQESEGPISSPTSATSAGPTAPTILSASELYTPYGYGQWSLGTNVPTLAYVGEIVVSWTASSGSPQRYDLQEELSNGVWVDVQQYVTGGGFHVGDDIGSSMTSVAFTAPTDGAPLPLRLRAYANGIYSPFSPVFTPASDLLTLTSTAVAGQMQTTDITMAWSSGGVAVDVSGLITGYQFRLDPAYGAIATAGNTETSWPVTGVSDATDLYVTVTLAAKDPAGTPVGVAGLTTFLQAKVGVYNPQNYQGPVVTAPTPASSTLPQWAFNGYVSSEVGYDLEYMPLDDANDPVEAYWHADWNRGMDHSGGETTWGVGGSGFFPVPVGFIDGVKYAIRVRWYNSVAYSAWFYLDPYGGAYQQDGYSYQAPTAAQGGPPEPTGLTVTVDSPTQVTLECDADANVESFWFRDADGANHYATWNDNVATVTGLVPGATYTFQVAESPINWYNMDVYAIGYGITSSFVNFQPVMMPLGAAPPTAPGQIDNSLNYSSHYFSTVNTVGLMWSDTAGDETGFEIERATDSGFTQSVVTFYVLDPNVFEYFDTTVATNTTYWYQICSINSDGTSTPWVPLGSQTT